MNYPYKYEEYDRFKTDLFKEFGVTDNPKREKAFSIAWERGHASGYYEVELCFMNIVELIKD